MFKCNNCKKNDRFELMFSPDYKGKRTMDKKFNADGNIVITVDGYTFTPDLAFMNAHAVCNYCGSINCWEYSYDKENSGIKIF